jgi:GTP cyclohydrolase FolE2
VSLPDPLNRSWQKKQLGKIVRRIRDCSVGRADYSEGEFVEDVKRACASDAIPFDNDLFSELTRSKLR